jgi:hypothetical protein
MLTNSKIKVYYMLKWFDSDDFITDIPQKYKATYELCISRMSAEERDAIDAELTRLIENSIAEGSNIVTSSWIPGRRWQNTVYMPIYEKAARGNEELAAKIFGLILYELIINRPESWYCGRFEKDGIPIKGITYFIKN